VFSLRRLWGVFGGGGGSLFSPPLFFRRDLPPRFLSPQILYSAFFFAHQARGSDRKGCSPHALRLLTIACSPFFLFENSQTFPLIVLLFFFFAALPPFFSRCSGTCIREWLCSRHTYFSLFCGVPLFFLPLCDGPRILPFNLFLMKALTKSVGIDVGSSTLVLSGRHDAAFLSPSIGPFFLLTFFLSTLFSFTGVYCLFPHVCAEPGCKSCRSQVLCENVPFPLLFWLHSHFGDSFCRRPPFAGLPPLGRSIIGASAPL